MKRSKRFSLSVDTITEIVNNISRQYAKDIHSGSGFSQEKYQEYRSELFVKAYEVMSDGADISINLMYKILFNKASDVFHVMMDSSTKEFANQFINLDVDDLLDKEEFSYNDEYEEIDEDLITEGILKDILQLIESKPSNIRKYVIAKIMLAGISIDKYMPEDDPDLQKVEELGVSMEDAKEYKSVDEYVLTHINQYSESSARTGGPGSFKVHKSQVREDYIYSNNLDPITYKSYEITYMQYAGDVGGEVTRKVRAYDLSHAERLLNQYLDRRGITKDEYYIMSITVL